MYSVRTPPFAAPESVKPLPPLGGHGGRRPAREDGRCRTIRWHGTRTETGRPGLAQRYVTDPESPESAGYGTASRSGWRCRLSTIARIAAMRSSWTCPSGSTETTRRGYFQPVFKRAKVKEEQRGFVAPIGVALSRPTRRARRQPGCYPPGGSQKASRVNPADTQHGLCDGADRPRNPPCARDDVMDIVERRSRRSIEVFASTLELQASGSEWRVEAASRAVVDGHRDDVGGQVDVRLAHLAQIRRKRLRTGVEKILVDVEVDAPVRVRTKKQPTVIERNGLGEFQPGQRRRAVEGSPTRRR